jgi:chaperonin GroES
MTNIGKPLGDRVLVKPAPKNEERKTESGLFIPDSAMTDDVKYADVVAVGDGLFTQTGTPIPMSVKVGDKVLLPAYHQGQDIKLGGVDYIILRESEMLMVL